LVKCGTPVGEVMFGTLQVRKTCGAVSKVNFLVLTIQ